MPTVFDGSQQAAQGRYAVVVSRYNESITQRLLDGAVQTLQAAGICDDAIEIAWVPGAWELPVVAARFARQGEVDAVICLGAVIRGETSHDKYINSQVSGSLGSLCLEYDLPVLFGLLTCETIEQAIHRAGGNMGNKGVQSAQAAIEMVNVMCLISESSDP